MSVNYLILIFTGLYLAGTFLLQICSEKGIEFRYKPITLLVVAILFLVALYGIIVGKQLI